MDCEKFDEHVIDALYEELDELTAAALKRHTDGCARCAGILAGLKAGREGAVLQLEEPSGDLEARILEAERAAQKRAPWPRKLMRAAAWAGSHAMRPQLAMAALFMLVVGSSLLLLRARPGTVGAPVEVTDRGEPTPAATAAPESGALRGRTAKGMADQGAPGEQRLDGAANEPRPAPPADVDKDVYKESARPAATAAAMAEASAAPAAKPAIGGAAPDTPQQALSWARDGRATAGCTEALTRYGEVAKRFPSTPEADAANREANECQHEVAAEGPPPPASPAADGKNHAAPAKTKPAASAAGSAKPADLSN